MADLASTPGVSGVAVIHAQPEPDPKRYPPEAVACTELTGVPALGHCPPGAETVTMNPDYGGGVIDKSSMAQTIWPAAALTAAALQRLPIDTIVVGTDGSPAAVERARSVLELSGFGTLAPQTLSEIEIENARRLDSYRQLADVVILVSLPIAGCSLAVSVAGGLAERKRPFSLLRLTGAPLALLRRVIALETAAPLLISAVVSAGTGLLCAHLFLHAQLKETLQPPGAQYYLVVAGGLLVSLAVIASTLPLLNRLTGPESARNE